MKKYNYFYYGQPIPKNQFLKAVPEDWENYVKDGEYSWGGYRVTELD